MSRTAIEAALLEENRQRCEPPLEDDEVKKIAASVAKYSPAPNPKLKVVAAKEEAATPAFVASHSAPPIKPVRNTVGGYFPHLWPAVDLGLATCATLLLSDNANPTAVILVGPASTGKTTVAMMFADANICYRSDKFTPAAFVSHSAKATEAQLESIDLLPRIQYKVLMTPELSTMFRGKPDELLERFSIITRVLDGQGLITDSGTHDRRGYEGDYLFAWLGCTTPFDPSVWKIMAQLGSRLFFFPLEPDAGTDSPLLHANGSYPSKLTESREVVSPCLNDLFTVYGGVRGVVWNAAEESNDIIEQIGTLANLLSVLLSVLRTLPTYQDAPATPESPMRAHAVLYNLARGHAIVHGRTQLTEADLPRITQVTFASMPRERRQTLLAFLQAKSRSLTVAEVQAAIRARSDGKARSVMEDLDWLGIADYTKSGIGKASTLELRPPWQWITEPEFESLLSNANLLPNGG